MTKSVQFVLAKNEYAFFKSKDTPHELHEAALKRRGNSSDDSLPDTIRPILKRNSSEILVDLDALADGRTVQLLQDAEVILEEDELLVPSISGEEVAEILASRLSSGKKTKKRGKKGKKKMKIAPAKSSSTADTSIDSDDEEPTPAVPLLERKDSKIDLEVKKDVIDPETSSVPGPPRFDYFETADRMVISINVRKCSDSNTAMEIIGNSIVKIKVSLEFEMLIQFSLPEFVIGEKSFFKSSPMKLEVTLIKEKKEMWKSVGDFDCQLVDPSGFTRSLLKPRLRHRLVKSLRSRNTDDDKPLGLLNTGVVSISLHIGLIQFADLLRKYHRSVPTLYRFSLRLSQKRAVLDWSQSR